ncbi:MAG: hypothetical protein V3S37_03860 [Dehalococcoidia bacterium]
MFYDTTMFQEKLAENRDQRTHAIVVLTASESKRLIARGVVALPEVQGVLQRGLLVVSRGVTPAFIVDELTGDTLPKANCTAGIITDSRLAITSAEGRLGPWVFRAGRLVDEAPDVVLDEFSATDVSIKGANAIDPMGNAGILVQGAAGGTIGSIWPLLSARGAHLIQPVGLERLISSVIEASFKCGNRLFKYVMGAQVGLIPVVTSLVVTEIQALAVLTGVAATHVSSGGVGGSEGCVVLALEGSEDTVVRAYQLVESIKGEAAVPVPELMPAVAG